ncbi:hypothetical protein D9M70_619010 [compost metagenome]
MGPSTKITNIAQVRYTQAISLPRENSEPKPYLPIVNAMAPKAPIGARRMTMLTMRNMPCIRLSSVSTKGLPRGPTWARAIPSRIENSRICRTLPLAKASTMVSGMMFMTKSMNEACFTAVV